MSVEPNDDSRTRGQRFRDEACGTFILGLALACFAPLILGILDGYWWFWTGANVSGLEWGAEKHLRGFVAIGFILPGIILIGVGANVVLGVGRDRKDAVNVGK